MIRKRDWFWLLAFPLYLVVGTFRHEFAHAVVAHAQGAEIIQFVFYPSIQKDGLFYFGYVSWRGATTWVVDAAPYLLDVITYVLCFPCVFCFGFRQHWLWLNLVILGLISPIVNSLYNYLRGSDVRNLLEELPDLPVHGFFLLGLGLSFFGLLLIFTKSKQAQKERET